MEGDGAWENRVNWVRFFTLSRCQTVIVSQRGGDEGGDLPKAGDAKNLNLLLDGNCMAIAT